MHSVLPLGAPWVAGDSCNLTFPLYEGLDQTRRWQRWALDMVGAVPTQAPGTIIFHEPGVTLKGYGTENCPGEPALLLVPAPIKRAYIWDLAAGASVVSQCLQHGFNVYLLQWESPGAAESGFGLAEYADRLILDCLEAIEADTRQARTFLAGHSLGGTLAAIFTTLNQERVRGLVLLGAPLHFGPKVGVFGPFAALAKAQSPTPIPGRVPGSLLSALSFAVAPKTFGLDRCEDWFRSLSRPSALRTHLLVERWALDELPMPRRLFEEVVIRLVQRDEFMSGTLKVGERDAVPERITVPVLCVADARCEIVPPAAVLPFYEAVNSSEKKLLWYKGDTGVCLQHVGFLVGETALQQLWPEILVWVETQG